MVIKNKRESVARIKELGLNTFAVDIFGVKDIDGITKFFIDNPAQEYVMRDPINPQGEFFFVRNIDECIANLTNYYDLVTIVVSWNEYKEDIVLLGDIKVKKGYSSDEVDITARTDINATHRNIYENPKYNLHTNLEDDRLWNIPGFSKLIKYIVDHDLYDLVIEFIVYDCPVGIKKEKIVIAELRSEY